MTSPAEELDDIICNGVALDVYQAWQANALLNELDLHVEGINRTGTGKHFFANLQLILQRQALLSLARGFEDVSRRYPKRSIPAALALLRKHGSELVITDTTTIHTMLGITPLISAPTATADPALTERLVDHVETRLNSSPADTDTLLTDTLAAVRELRNKAIAHPEQIEASKLPKFKWAGIEELIELADEFVRVVARGYLNIHNDIEYDATRSALSLRRLLTKAGLPSPTAIAGGVG